MMHQKNFRALLMATAVASLALPAAHSLAQAPAAQPATPQINSTQAAPTLSERVSDLVRTVTGDPTASADRDMKRVLDAMADLNPKPIEQLTPEEARRQPAVADAIKELQRRDGQPTLPTTVVKTQDTTIPGPAGPIQARIYMPAEANAATPMPVILYWHGGGFVIADLDTYDATPRAMAVQAKAIVISAHYRQAPEHKFPAAHDDAFATYRWVLDNAAQIGGDPRRIALMGESAGGNLAIDTAIRARDENLPAPIHQVLIYPLAGADLNSPSYRENESAKPLNKAMIQWFVGHLLTSPDQTSDPRIDVIGRADVSRLPGTTIVTAQIDPLRSDGERLAVKLREAGVAVDARNYDGVTHEFFGLAAAVADAREAQAYVATRLTESFGAAR